MGGVTIYGEEVRALILGELSSGRSLNEICSAQGMPAESTVRGWEIEDNPPGFAANYMRARSLGIDALAERALSVARDKERDPNCRRVEIDTIKWFTGKMRPAKYGERVVVAGDAESPLKQVVNVTIQYADKPSPS